MGKKITAFFFFLLLIAINQAYGQNILLKPAQGYFLDNPGELKYKLLFSPSDSVVFSWSYPGGGSPQNLKILVGAAPGSYNFRNFNVSGTRYASLPENQPLNLSTGRYYAIVTNSNKTTLNEIKADFVANPGSVYYSNEVQFIVEAQTTPVALSPTGVITDPTPVFEWTAIPGVPAYFLIVSSTPFEVVTLENGEVSVEGANIVWEYITTETSIQYGEVDPNSPYNILPPPLIPGNEYNYTIINMYDQEDIAFASTVFGGVVPFTYEGDSFVEPPQLVSPADSSVFYGDEVINFSWDPVDNVNNYTIYLYERVTTFAGNNQQIDIPIWNSTTTNTQIEYPARTTLSKGNYVWNVVPNDDQGTGNVSETYQFSYILETGKFVVTSKSTADQSNLLNFEVEVNAIENGVSPANPIVVSNSQSFTDSLVIGTYEFTGSKAGFYDSTFTVEITEDVTAYPVMWLRPFPSVISGEVKNQAGSSISNAVVYFTNILNSAHFQTTTSSNGSFSISVPKATYSVEVSKPGYLSPAPRIVTANNNQVVLSTALVLTQDNAFISGKVLNDLGQPVKQATITAKKGNISFQTTSNSNGNYSFTLSSGNWTVTATKTGFVSPDPAYFTLNTGDNLQNENIWLIPRANQVSGFVYRNTSGGSTPFEGITVTAIPSSGTPVTTVTSQTGEYNLSLRSGTYDISVAKSGFTANDPVQMTLGVGQTISGVNFNLTPNPSTISGVVQLPGGNAISGAVVFTNSGVTTTTLPNGTFTLSVSSGTRIVNVQKQGFIPPDARTVNVAPGQNLSGLTLVMSPNAGTIKGKVFNLQQPLVNALITASANGQNYTALTNSSGDYTISLPPASYSVTASKSGFLPDDVITVNIGPGQVSPGNNFSLISNTASFQGTVVSASGTQINGASVQIAEVNNPQNMVSTLSNVSGYFAATVEAGKSYTVTVSKSGYNEFVSNYTNLEPASVTNVNAVLTASPSSIAGKVKNNSQVSVSGATVTFYLNGTAVKTVASGANGNYTAGLSAGNYKVKVSKAGYFADSVNVTLALGQNITGVNFTLAENFAYITGTVTDLTSVPLEGAVINLNGNNGGATTLSGVDGGYTLQNITGGVYDFTVEKDGYSDTLIAGVTINDGQALVYNFNLYSLSGEINGTVSDANGNIVASATVILVRKSNNNQRTATTGNNGEFSFSGLNYGDFEIRALKTGFTASQVQEVTISPSQPVQSVVINDLTEKTSVISGTIRDDVNAPISGVEVFVNSDNGSSGAVTDNSGSFEIRQLAPGEYNLTTRLSGYMSIDTTFTLSGAVSLSLVMPANKSSIQGKVTNTFGEVLPFIIPVTAVTENKTIYTGMTNENGNYTITGVPDNSQFTLYSGIFRQGYINDTSEVFIQQGTSVVTVNLEIKENLSVVEGNAGTANAVVNLISGQSGVTVSTNASASGEFTFGYLAAGTYTVKPTKPGFVFTPAERTVSPGIKDTVVNIDFTATANTGTINVSVKENNGAGVSGVQVSVVSSDESVVLNGTANSSGNISFTNVPAGKEYIVTPYKDGYTAEPLSRRSVLNNNDVYNPSFVMTENTGSIQGFVFRRDNNNMIPVEEAVVVIEYNSGVSFSVQSGEAGIYEITGIPAGEAVIYAQKPGYSGNSYDVVITGSTVTKNLEMSASVITIRGYVFYNGEGAGDIDISLNSSSSLFTTTKVNGQYVFNDVALQNDSDTTLFVVRLEEEGLPDKSRILKIASDQAGTVVYAQEINLPSGTISFTVNDGEDIIPGVKVSFTGPDGSSDVAVTGDDGLYETGEDLQAGTYRVSLEKSGYLSPEGSYTNVSLPSDTTKIDTMFMMPYMFEPADTILADQPTDINVTYNGNFGNSVAFLHYRKATASSFNMIPMIRSGNRFTGVIPALFSLEEIMYYVEVTNLNNSMKYNSDEYSVKPLASGILSSLLLTPSLNGTVLRSGDEYEIHLTIRDGLNKPLTDKFAGENHSGILRWNMENAPGINFEFPDDNDSTKIIIRPESSGFNEVKITTILEGVSKTKTIMFEVSDLPLQSLELASPVRRLNNRAAGVQYNYSGIDTLNRSVTLGNMVEWSLDPENSGNITPTGFYSPADTSYIGFPEVTITDKITGLEAVASLVVYAEVIPEESFVLTDYEGMELWLPAGSVPIPLQISLERPQSGPTKKQFTPLGTNVTYNVSDKMYSFTYRSSMGLPGDSLTKPAVLTLPVDKSIALFDGAKEIGHYNINNKEWMLYDSESGNNELSITGFAAFGEYSVLTQNEPLGIKHLAVLPSPFSPVVSPLKIGYFLTTPDRAASVTIKIYNVRGELVKTVTEDDLQPSGRYGSRTGIKEITWDGKTDGGYMARNGRYIIKIDAKDSTGEKSEMIQVVLVK